MMNTEGGAFRLIQRNSAKLTWEQAATRAANAHGFTLAAVICGGQTLPMVRARYNIIRVLRMRGWSTKKIALVVGRDHTTICHALKYLKAVAVIGNGLAALSNG